MLKQFWTEAEKSAPKAGRSGEGASTPEGKQATREACATDTVSAQAICWTPLVVSTGGAGAGRAGSSVRAACTRSGPTAQNVDPESEEAP